MKYHILLEKKQCDKCDTKIGLNALLWLLLHFSRLSHYAHIMLTLSEPQFNRD